MVAIAINHYYHSNRVVIDFCSKFGGRTPYLYYFLNLIAHAIIG